MTVRILAMSGSSRRDSLNQRLLARAAAGAQEAGAHVTLVRLADYGLPIYDADVEAEHGLPEGARAFQAVTAEHDAVLIATPEHNGGYTALLKNAIDWLSRPRPDGRPGASVLTGKAAAVVSASPGLLGGVRSQTALRMVLEKLGVMVITQSMALGGAHEAFDEGGRLKDAAADGTVRSIGRELARVAGRLR